VLDTLFAAAAGPPYGTLADPPSSSVLLAAVSWLEGTLLGSLAFSAAVIATAAVGFMMLSGRLSVRPGLTVILGSFVLFGAATIAAGIRASAGGSPAPAAAYAPPAPPRAATLREAPPSALPRDPHAGASVPTE
jgi:type IV secretory pathway VirB2 component (pilin)